MRSVLITGFEPFDGERVNPSWEVVKKLNDLMLGGVKVVARQLPCAFGAALTALNAAMDDIQPVLVLAMVQAIREAGIPASVSQTAGTYVCNHVMYGLLHRLHQVNDEVKGGFIHIPYLPEQAVNHPGAPSMSEHSVMIALELAISIALQIDHDLHISGGAIH
ncbi:pyroglutamyl-peptidase I [Yersinia kristensenii]|nr:pyroglutamyl-peptidase I [Yersinia kristensenii]